MRPRLPLPRRHVTPGIAAEQVLNGNYSTPVLSRARAPGLPLPCSQDSCRLRSESSCCTIQQGISIIEKQEQEQCRPPHICQIMECSRSASVMPSKKVSSFSLMASGCTKSPILRSLAHFMAEQVQRATMRNRAFAKRGHAQAGSLHRACSACLHNVEGEVICRMQQPLAAASTSMVV